MVSNFYTCKCCKYSSPLKTNYERHLKSKKHSKLFEKSTKVNKSQQLSQQKVNKNKEYLCKYCCKEFTTKQSMYRHIKYTCEKNKDEDLKELVRLLNEQMQQMSQEMKEQGKELENSKKENEKLQKRISKLSNKLQINTTINTNTNNIGVINNNNNIILNNYSETDLSHLTPKDYKFMIKEVNNCIPRMIERVHFNPEKPENMNVYISNMKNKFIMVYKDGSWKLCNRNHEIDKMMDVKCAQLSEWLDENNQYTNLKQCFEKMEENMKNKNVKTSIQEEMKLILYNNRGLLQDTIEDDEHTEEEHELVDYE